MPALHRVLLATLLVGNTLVFAGVDPWTRFATAVIVVVLMVDLRRLPALPEPALWAAAGLAALVVAQLVPLPEIVRRLVEPGYSEVMRSGWAPLSLAPWATVMTASSIFVAFAVALVAARMAGTRSGLPVLLALLAVTCGLIGVLGLGSESGAPEKVMLLRANTGGGGTYGPFVELEPLRNGRRTHCTGGPGSIHGRRTKPRAIRRCPPTRGGGELWRRRLRWWWLLAR